MRAMREDPKDPSRPRWDDVTEWKAARAKGRQAGGGKDPGRVTDRRALEAERAPVAWLRPRAASLRAFGGRRSNRSVLW